VLKEERSRFKATLAFITPVVALVRQKKGKNIEYENILAYTKIFRIFALLNPYSVVLKSKDYESSK